MASTSLREPGADATPPAPAVVARAFAQALDAAQAWVGATAPNPAVGCVLLDRAGEVLACAAHQRAGGAHAEAAALAEVRARGATAHVHTAVVTLEPCSHIGRTGPCADALLTTPVRHVWIGAPDPHPRAPGAGAARLSAAGLVVRGIADLEHADARALAAGAARLVAPFAKHVRTGRPWVVVKTARDARGSMIPPPGATTFTSDASLDQAHRLRREADAIVTGSGCVLADDPAFTVRRVADHPGKRRLLAILDRRRRVPAAYLEGARARGLDARIYDDLDAMLDDLGSAGALSALVEAGPTLRAALIERHLWDEEVVFTRSADAGAADTVETRRPLP